MRKLAIFVEGQTEVIFVEKLLQEVGNKKDIAITIKSRNNQCPITSRLIAKDNKSQDIKYKILIYNSCNDEAVLSDIKEQYENLINNGYELVIGLRDLYPKEFSKLNKIKNRIDGVLKKDNLDRANIIIAVMEVETWFLAELNHYNKIDEKLTLNLIKNKLLDLNSISNFESEIEKPAKTLHNIYELVGKFYDKNRKRVLRTVNSLDYEELYLNNRNNLSSLNEFLTHIDNFFVKGNN